MSAQRAVRWSGSGIGNGRLRLAAIASNARHYSLYAQRTALKPSRLPTQPFNTSRTSNFQQTRSISIFGWGSSKPTSDEFTSAHAPPQVSPPAQNIVEAVDAKTASIEQIRTIKAAHGTSDVPDPSVTSIPTHHNQISEPTILRELEDAIATPEGAVTDSTELATIPERIGYLKEACGLDYGWGTSTIMENVFEHLHITGGLPWAASIVGGAIFVRLLVFAFVYRGADQAQKMRDATDILAPLRAEAAKAQLARDTRRVLELGQEMRAVNKELGVSWSKAFMPMIIQVPFAFSSFRVLRGMSTVPVPALETEHWLWTTDLTVGDPYYVVPLVQGALMYVALQKGTEMGASPMAGPMKTFATILPVISVVWSVFQPGCIQLFFLTSSTMACMQTFIMQSNRARALLRMGPKPSSRVPTTTTPGGMSRYSTPPGKIIDIEPSAPVANRSVIDKVVDAAKAQRQKVSDGLKPVLGKTEEKLAQKRKEQFAEKAEKHEYKRKQEISWEREARNQAKLQTKTGPGGMKILQKEDKRTRK